MSQLSPTEIAQAAYAAGFRGQALTTAVACALAESGGNPDAHNSVPPDNSYGLWQVNMLGALGPDRRSEFGLKSNDDLFNPETNAKAAYAISDNGKSFTPWSTYTDGAYKDHWSEAEKAAQEVTNNHGKAPGGHQPPDKGGPPPPSPIKQPGKPKQPPGKGGNGKGGGFKVDPGALATYTKAADRVGSELNTIGQRTAQAVDNVTDTSFGAVGKETGFTAALDEFTTELKKQVSTLSADADQMGRGAAQTAANYQETEEGSARAISNVLG